MEETGKWIAGIILSITALISTWIIASNSKQTAIHKDLYEKMNEKADIDFVKEEIKKMNENINSRLDLHLRESETINELLLHTVGKQGDLIKSIDENVRIVLSQMIKK